MFIERRALLQHHPSSLHILPDPIVSRPALAVASREGIEGAGIGYGEEPVRCAIGEAYERNHFFAMVPIHREGKLSAILEPGLLESVRAALLQTADTKALDKLESHSFSFTESYSLRDAKMKSMPTAMISVSPDLASDGEFLPVRDTGGCAAGATPEKAFSKALCEFTERQNLTASWLTQRYQEIDLITESRLINSSTNSLLTQLKQQGQLKAFELSHGTPGATVMIVDFAKGSLAASDFAAGLACDLDPHKALERAVIELWASCASSALIPYSESIEKMLSEGPFGAKQAQGSSGTTYFLRNAERTILIDDVLSVKPCYGIGEFVSSLVDLGGELFYYANCDAFHDNIVHFAKVFSPEFYLHTQLGHRFNAINGFSRKTGIDKHELNGPIPLYNSHPYVNVN